MSKRPVIALTAAIGLTDAIRARGGDSDAILRSVGLDRADIDNPQGFIACADFAALLETAAQATGDDCFGLHFGEQYHPKNAGPLSYVVLNSPTIGAALENVARYITVRNEGARASFALQGSWGYARLELLDPSVDATRQHGDYAMAVALNTIRLMAGSHWSPVEVRFAHKTPPETSEHLRVFGAPLAFDCPANAFVVERNFAERQVPAADERLYPIMKRYLDRVLEEMPREDDLLSTVRKVVGAAIRHGDPKLADVASQLATGPRTLQRRLKEHGMEFNELVDDTRRRFSLSYLNDPNHTLTEIAYLLGYSEVSAFNRAFKRWTGTTPSEHRRQRAAMPPVR